MSKRINGLYLNADPVDQPEGFYRSAKNIILDESIGAVSNESGTILEDSIPEGNISIGTLLLSDESVVIFSVSTTSENSEIGVFIDGNYSTILNSSSLNFNINYPIQSTFYVNGRNEHVIIWTDGFNKPRILNIDNPVSDFNYTSLFPHVEKPPKINVQSINQGEGSLQSGVYYFTCAYIDNESDDIITDFFTITNPVSVRPAWENTTNASITLSIENLDINYQKIQLAVIKKIDNIIDEVELLPVMSTNSATYTYDGNEGHIPGSLAEIQIDNAFYSLVKTLHINDDKLYMGNLEEDKDIGYQRYANDIKSHLVTKEIKNWNPEDPLMNHIYKGYFKGETYAFYISWLMKEGGESKAYHIPGRQPVSGDFGDFDIDPQSATGSSFVNATPTSDTSLTFTFDGHITTVTNIFTTDSPSDIATKIANAINADNDAKITSTSNDENLFFTDKEQRSSINGQGIVVGLTNSDWNDLQEVTDFPLNILNIIMTGGIGENESDGQKLFMYESIPDSEYRMGYWENENETYPNTNDWVSANGQDLRNQKVRHHSFPDVKHLDGYWKYKYPVGIRFTNISIPEELEGRVNGYKIYYAKKDSNNKKILDQSISMSSALKNISFFGKDESMYGPRTRIEESAAINPRTIYTHPFSLLRKKSNINNVTHIQVVDSTQTITNTFETEIGAGHVHIARSVDHTASNTYSFEEHIPVIAKAYVNAATAYGGDSTRSVRTNLKKFGFDRDMDNFGGESKLLLRLSESLPVNYHIINIRSLKRNLFNSFDNQILVHTGYVHTNMNNLDSSAIYGGDAFTNQFYSYKATRQPTNSTIVGVHINEQLQSYDNLFLRKEGNEQWETYYPKSELVEFSAIHFKENGNPEYTNSDNFDFTYVDNYFGYDDGESSVNDIKFPMIYPKRRLVENVYPTRIVRSDSNFRVFKQNDYLDLSKKRGGLTKIDTYNNILIPHMRRALVRTRGQEELQVDEISAFLGTGNIFNVKPEEIIYTEDGFGGLLHFTHSKSTPYGYFFYDGYSNKVYMLNNEGLKDITEPLLPVFKEFNINDFILNAPSNFNFEIINE